MVLAIETCGLTRTFTRRLVGRYSSYAGEGNPGAYIQQLLVFRFSSSVKTQTVVAVDHIDLTVEQGSLVGLLGPNGSGKTTLLRLLAGLFHPTDGTAHILGHDLVQEPEIIPKLVNYVPGLLSGGAWLDGNLSARKNLNFYADIFSLPRQRVDEALEMARLSHLADSRVATFSTGMFAKLALAAGLLKETPLYLMDEPMLGISRELVLEMRQYIKEHLCRELGATVLYATHNLEEAQYLSDKVLVMHEGRMLVQGRPTDLVRSIGKQDAIEIEAQKIGPDTEARLRSIGGVNGVACRIVDTVSGRGSIRIHTDNTRDTLPLVVSCLVEGGVRIRFLRIEEPTLEDVFLHLIGRGTEAGLE